MSSVYLHICAQLYWTLVIRPIRMQQQLVDLMNSLKTKWAQWLFKGSKANPAISVSWSLQTVHSGPSYFTSIPIRLLWAANYAHSQYFPIALLHVNRQFQVYQLTCSHHCLLLTTNLHLIQLYQRFTFLLKHTEHIPALGPLNLLFPLPRKFFPQMF